MKEEKLILDSFALIAYFEDEPGADKVEKVLKEEELNKCTLLMSIVNWGEVYYSLYRSKGEDKAEESLLILDQLPIRLLLVDRTQTHQAAKLKAKYPVAFADCFATALALQNQAKILTGDLDFEKLEKEIEVEWLPKKK
jgi:ribonuclease VapC